MTVAPFAQVLAQLGRFGHFQVQLLILLSVPSFLLHVHPGLHGPRQGPLLFSDLCQESDSEPGHG